MEKYRITQKILDGGIGRFNGNGTIPPGIVGVGADLHTRLGIYRYNIAKDILFEIVGVKFTGVIACGSVLEANGRTAFIVQVYQQHGADGFADNPRTIKSVDVLHRA